MSQNSIVKRNSVIKRRSTPETKAGQYMCPECGKIFDTGMEVSNHIKKFHKPKIKSVLNNLNGYYTE